MIDIAKAMAQSNEWGISLAAVMELRIHVYGNVDAFGDYNEDDCQEEDWRSRVAQVLIENQLAAKANRYIECSRYGVRYQCQGKDAHNLFSPIYCDLRYCPRCGPRQFARLIEKYAPEVSFVSASPYEPIARNHLNHAEHGCPYIRASQAFQ